MPHALRYACVAFALCQGCAASSRTFHVVEEPLLRDSIASLIKASGGRAGVVAIHAERGERFAIDPELPVFMSSVVKLPIVVQLLDRVDRHELRLDDEVTLRARDLRIGNGGLAAEYPNGGARLSIRALIERAIVTSDNSASDALLAYSGGARRVMAELERLHIAGVRIDSTYSDIMWTYYGITHQPDSATWSPALFERLTSEATAEQRARGARSFLSAPTNRATADGLATLLLRLVRGELLSDSSRTLLLGLMRDSKNPAGRIVAGTPPGVTVAHKTGTMGSWENVYVSVNDVGILTLPDDSHLILAVMLAGGTAPYADQEKTIARITNLVVRHWMR